MNGMNGMQAAGGCGSGWGSVERTLIASSHDARADERLGKKDGQRKEIEGRGESNTLKREHVEELDLARAIEGSVAGSIMTEGAAGGAVTGFAMGFARGSVCGPVAAVVGGIFSAIWQAVVTTIAVALPLGKATAAVSGLGARDRAARLEFSGNSAALSVEGEKQRTQNEREEIDNETHRCERAEEFLRKMRHDRRNLVARFAE